MNDAGSTSFPMESDDEGKSIRARIRLALALSGVAVGAIEPTDKSDDELKREIFAYFDSFLEDTEGQQELRYTIDHTQSLRRRAEEHLNIDPEMAALFYATYFEHSINGVISHFIQKLGLGEDVAISAIRSLSLEAKLSWFIDIIGAPPFPVETARIIKKVADVRNCFVHYKWPMKDDRERVSRKREIGDILRGVNRAVETMEDYVDQSIYKGCSKRIELILSSLQE